MDYASLIGPIRLHERQTDVHGNGKKREQEYNEIVDVFRRQFYRIQQVNQHFPFIWWEGGTGPDLLDQLEFFDYFFASLGNPEPVQKEHEVTEYAEIPDRPDPGRLHMVNDNERPEGNGGG